MSESTAETDTSTEGEGSQGDQTAAETDTTDWKAEARKWEQRAKDNSTKAKELEKQQRASMTEAERAVSEAEERGRTAAATDFGKELAQTQFDALAGRRNPDFDTTKALKRLDLASLLDESGRPNAKEIKAAVEDLVPEPAKGAASFDGGARGTAASSDMNTIIRKAAGRG